jgi:hypothetical protein
MYNLYRPQELEVFLHLVGAPYEEKEMVGANQGL